MGASRAGDRLFVAFDEVGARLHLLTYDVSGPDPMLLHQTSVPRISASSAAPYVRGSTVVVGRYVFDVSAGAAVLRATIPCDEVLDWSGRYLAGLAPVGEVFSEMRVFDLADPVNPVWLSALPIDTAEQNVLLRLHPRLHGNHLLVPAGRRGLVTYRISEPGGLRERMATGHPGAAVFAQTIRGSVLYSAEAFAVGGGLAVWDVSGAPAVELTTVLFGAETPYATLLAGDHLIVGTDGSLHVFDVAAPQTLVPIASVPSPAIALAISAQHLFASSVTPDGSPVLSVFDISDPASPRQVGAVPLPGLPIKLAFAENVVYGAAEEAGLLTVDVSRPSSPSLLAQWSPAPYVEDVILDGNLALLAVLDRGVLIADVTHPGMPVQISETTLPRWPALLGFGGPSPEALSLALRRGYVYVGTAHDSGRVYVLDHRNPARPRLVGMTEERGSWNSFVATFAFSTTEVFYGGWNDDPSSSVPIPFPPGAVADDTQPANVILLHPQVLESIVTTAGPAQAIAEAR